MFSPLFRAGCCCLRFSMHYPFISAVRRFFFIFLLFPFLLFPAAVVPCFFHPSFLFSVSCSLFPSFLLIFRADCCCLRFSMHCPFRRCILVVTSFSSLFSSVPRRGCPVLFLHFPSIPLPSIPRCGCSVFFHPSFLFSVSYALFPSFLLIFRTGCCCLRFSMHCPFISTVRRFSSFSFYSPSFYSPLRLFRAFFTRLFYLPRLTLFP